MPYAENTPGPHDLATMTLERIADLPTEILAILQRECETELKAAKAAKAQLDGALALRYADRAAEARRAAGKDTGTVRLEDGDLTVVAELPKRVEWDQEQLAEMVARIRAAGDDPTDYVDISYRVSERKYAAWPAPIRARFAPARTVRTGNQAFRLVENEEDR